VFPIRLPPLRERKEDIPLLIRHFIDHQNQVSGKAIKGVSHSAMRILMDHSWPGNVRELENAVEHAFVLCSGDTVDPFDLPVEIRQLAYKPASQRGGGGRSRSPGERLTRESLIDLLDACDWNKAEAGRRLGRSRTAIWKYMKKWGIPLQRPSS